MNSFVRLLAVIGTIILLVMAKAFFDGMMGWRRGGGAIPLTIFYVILIYCVRKVWMLCSYETGNKKIHELMCALMAKHILDNDENEYLRYEVIAKGGRELRNNGSRESILELSESNPMAFWGLAADILMDLNTPVPSGFKWICIKNPFMLKTYDIKLLKKAHTTLKEKYYIDIIKENESFDYQEGKEEEEEEQKTNEIPEEIAIDDDFYPSEENINNKQDKNETISNIQNTTQNGNKEISVYEHLSPQDIENLQEILESTNPDTPRIIKCHNCGSKLRVPAHKKIDLTCPHCKATRRLAT